MDLLQDLITDRRQKTGAPKVGGLYEMHAMGAFVTQVQTSLHAFSVVRAHSFIMNVSLCAIIFVYFNSS